MLPLALLVGTLSAGNLSAAVAIWSVSGAPTAPVPVGTTVTLNAVASDTDQGALRYRYRVSYHDGPYTTFVDYGPSATFNWTPAVAEGDYTIETSVLNRATGSTASATVSVSVTSRVVDGIPVVSPTSHPLVALYSAPPCRDGLMRVRFKTSSQASWQATSVKPCTGLTSMNFYVAGMRANRTYTLRNDVINGNRITTSRDLSFTTGDDNSGAPTTTVSVPLPQASSVTEGLTLFMPLQGRPVYAVDPDANLVWYLPNSPVYGTRIAPGIVSAGASPLDLTDPTVTGVYGLSADLANSGLREYDLAGNVVKDTNTEQINAQLAAMGLTFNLSGIHHEVRRLADGRYLLIAMSEVISDVQGPGTDILGDVVLLLDRNLQILWYWNSFDHLDVSRKAVLDEKCSDGIGGCVVVKAAIANDWTHGNSVSLAPDGNLVYSSRHQDFVYKIDFQNGTGDGHVIWRLGKDGDFTWNSTGPWPWQSHQHDAEYDEATGTLSLFDNGNARTVAIGGNSRGQVLQLDEVNRKASVLINADLGVNSSALGSAQRLSNGHYSFDSGFVTPTQATEVNGDGQIVGQILSDVLVYRTFRLHDLYSGSW
jgi:arylsulfate sulfotransferase